MRIYFTGAHATGKSTLAKYVSDAYSIPLIPEIARMVLSEQELQIESLRRDLKVSDQYQQQVFDKQIIEEDKYTGSFVSDRSALDTLAYACQHTRILFKLLQSVELRQYAEKLSQPQVYIFFVRPSRATLVQDGVRENISWDGIIAIDAQIKYILESFDLKYFIVNADSMQERVRLVDSIISVKS